MESVDIGQLFAPRFKKVLARGSGRRRTGAKTLYRLNEIVLSVARRANINIMCSQCFCEGPPRIFLLPEAYKADDTSRHLKNTNTGTKPAVMMITLSKHRLAKKYKFAAL